MQEIYKRKELQNKYTNEHRLYPSTLEELENEVNLQKRSNRFLTNQTQFQVQKSHSELKELSKKLKIPLFLTILFSETIA